MGKLNRLKGVKGYSNAEDILPACGDGVSMSSLSPKLAFYVQGTSIETSRSKAPMKITPHTRFDPVDCNHFSVLSFDKRCFWDCDTPKIPNPNRVVIIYDGDDSEGYEIPSKFVDWSKVNKWKPTFKVIGDE